MLFTLAPRFTPMRRRHRTVPSSHTHGKIASLLCVVVLTAVATTGQAAPKPAARPLDAATVANRIDNADDAFLAARDAFRSGDLARAAILAQRGIENVRSL